MPRARTHLPPSDTNALADFAPKELTKQEFGRRLLAMIVDKGWNQSELARRAGLNRDAVSTYVRGVSFPDPKNLRRLADVFGMEPGDLLPNTTIRAMESDVAPMLEIRQASGHPDKAWIRVNQLVSFKQAAAIFEVLQEKTK